MAKKLPNDATQLLEGAYAIESAQDNINYYKKFAALYDKEFADSLGYVYPQMLAAVFYKYAQSTDSKIVDIGCGTGLVAQALKAKTQSANTTIDGIDISAEMLATAKTKGLYTKLIQADLTAGVPVSDEVYGAVLSAGTFTFGHLGPEILPSLLAMGRANTLYCIGVNSVHYEQQGFAHMFDSMANQNMITPPVLETRNIYAPSENTDQKSSHANDVATVVIYRQL